MQRPAPPTIADLRAERVQVARVWCLNPDCQHYGVVRFEAIGAPSGFTFIDLPKTRRFVAGNTAPGTSKACRIGPPYGAGVTKKPGRRGRLGRPDRFVF